MLLPTIGFTWRCYPAGYKPEARLHQRFRVDAGASASPVLEPPNNIEKTTNTWARGDSSVTPKSGETSMRAQRVGFHATVGPMTNRFSGSSRRPLSEKFV